jgi:hypothetical protein
LDQAKSQFRGRLEHIVRLCRREQNLTRTSTRWIHKRSGFQCLTHSPGLLLLLCQTPRDQKLLSPTPEQSPQRSSDKITTSQPGCSSDPRSPHDSASPQPERPQQLLLFDTNSPKHLPLLHQPTPTNNRRSITRNKARQETKPNAMLSRAGHQARASEGTFPASASTDS